MTKALVLGGTRFFGIHLVESLLAEGVDVTIATTGKTRDTFGNNVDRITVDRNDLVSFKEKFHDKEWDVIYDQICYSPQDALDSIEVFSGKTKRYIMTSTLSVYDMEPTPFIEKDYNPYKYEIHVARKEEVSYQEGKRQAEAVFFQKAPFEVVAVRIPIVLGINDYTKRLLFHVEKIERNEYIHFTNLDARMGFISEKEAGRFIAWIGSQDFTGPINACANGTVALKGIISMIELATGKQAMITTEKDEENESPYNIPFSWTMSNAKATELGYTFSDLHEWLPELINGFRERV